MKPRASRRVILRATPPLEFAFENMRGQTHGVPPMHQITLLLSVEGEHAVATERNRSISFLDVIVKEREAVQGYAIIGTAKGGSAFGVPRGGKHSFLAGPSSFHCGEFL